MLGRNEVENPAPPLAHLIEDERAGQTVPR